jgi:predicted lipoprotein
MDSTNEKEELLARLPIGPMREAHRTQSIEFIRESVRTWETADEATREDIMAFFESGGPAKVAKAKKKFNELN